MPEDTGESKRNRLPGNQWVDQLAAAQTRSAGLEADLASAAWTKPARTAN